MDRILEGENLFSSGKIDESEKLFREILKLDEKNKRVFNNLGVIAFQKGDTEEAFNYIIKAIELDYFYKDAILNFVAVLKGSNALTEAIPVLENAVGEMPDDVEISNALEEAYQQRSRRLKIAVLCLPGLENFLSDIVNCLKSKYEVRTCYSNNTNELKSAVLWADVVWLEWTNELTVFLTGHDTILDNKKVICRLHSYEAFSGYVKQIKWSKIDALIFVAEHIKNIVLEQVPGLAHQVNIHILPNGINLDKFSYKERTKGKNLAYVGYINYKKGPMLLLHAFRELVQRDKQYRLFIAGKFQDARYQLYFSQMIRDMDLEKNLIMNGWVDDVASWLEDKHYIVCTSVLEGHPVGLMEAMARGIKPLIHNFVGARTIYPDKFIWNSIPDFIQMVRNDGYQSIEYRDFIASNFPLKRQTDALLQIMNKFEIDVHTKKQNHGMQTAPFYLTDISPGDPKEESQENRHRDKVDIPEVTSIQAQCVTDSVKSCTFKYWLKRYLPYIRGDQFSNGLKLHLPPDVFPYTERIPLIEKLVKGKQVIHVGFCDHIGLIENKINAKTWLHKRIMDVSALCIGIDINEEAVDFCRNKLDIQSCLCFDITKGIPSELDNRIWDMLLLGEMLEHVPNPVSFLQAVMQGIGSISREIVISVPNALSLQNQMFCKQNVECINSDHNYWFTPYILARIIYHAGAVLNNMWLVQSYPPQNAREEEVLTKTPTLRNGIVASFSRGDAPLENIRTVQ